MNLLLTGCLEFTERQLNDLKEKFKIFFWQDETKKINFDVSKIDAVVVNNLFLYNDISEFVNLKLIQLTSSGLDRIPLDYIKNHSIKVFNADNVYSIPIAEYVVLKILEIYKNTYMYYENQKNRIWKKEYKANTLVNKKISIVGYGNIGNEVAKRLKSFQTYISAIDIVAKTDSTYIDEFYIIKDIKMALSNSDVVIISVPLNNETKHMFDYNLLKMIKKNSILINVSRGSIIKTEDLITCLNENHFLRVVLDVFEKEPLDCDSELWNKVNITPHISYISETNQSKLFELIKSNLENELND